MTAPRAALGGIVLVAAASWASCDAGGGEDGAGGATTANTSTSGTGGETGDGGADATTTAPATTASATTGGGPCTDAASCDDGDPCTEDSCGADGRCAYAAVAVDDGNFCTIDGCDPIDGPTHVEHVADDGDPCSLDLCEPDVGTTFLDDEVLFADDFHDESGGWTFEAPWEIGPAEGSSPNGAGMADPADDASPSEDGGVAGVTLGGSPPGVLEGTFHLESPPVDADLPGFVTLEYRRWLGQFTAQAPTVEVWDGAAWVAIWTTPRDVADAPPRGDGWVLLQHDLTALKSAELRVRFGVTLGDGGSAPSWNLDDVTITRRGWAVDGDACTVDACDEDGPAATDVDLDDDDDCTLDICHPAAGVAHVPVSCSDDVDGCCPAGCPSDPDCGAGGAGG